MYLYWTDIHLRLLKTRDFVSWRAAETFTYLLLFELLEQPSLHSSERGHHVVIPFLLQRLLLELEPLEVGFGLLLEGVLSQSKESGLVTGTKLLFVHVGTHHATHELTAKE